ncbi:MAG: hypothetical protein M0Q51_12940 [Bacteroidales bacterium]|nr:hypothetical protein [Bacteroidales bacterium]
MTPEGQFKGTWSSSNQEISINLPFIIFEEGGAQVVYCPALDVSGYGNNEEEAFESFKVCLGEFLLYTTHKKTFTEELRRLGWTIKKSKFKPMVPPQISQLLEENDNFSRIFNNYPFRKIDHSVSLPA